MSTFLELVQKTARETGLFATVPATAQSQTGKNLRLVNHVIDAWGWVQRRHTSWRWMRAEFSGSLLSAVDSYSPSDLGITTFGRWVTDNLVDGYFPTTVYMTSTGVTDEPLIREISWERWRTRWGRGSHDNMKPIEYAIAPDNAFRPGPTPGATYTVQGEYQKSVQTLSADADEPECPDRFHDVIVWKALLLYSEFEEALLSISRANRNFEIMMDELERDQLDEIRIGGGPLA